MKTQGTKIVHKRGVYNEHIVSKLRDGEVFYDITGEHGIWMGNEDPSGTVQIKQIADVSETPELVWERGTGEGSAQLKNSDCKAEGVNSVAEGYASMTITEGEGEHCGDYAHAEGIRTTAVGAASHTEGGYTRTNNPCEHAEGRGNVSNIKTTSFGDSGNTIHSVGIGGTEIGAFKNAFEIMQNGDTYLIRIGNYDGTEVKSSTNNVKTLQDVIAEIESIAKGKSTGLVFDTKADMEEWLSDEDNKGILKQGDNLYIKELEVPDYWVSAVLEEKDEETGFWYEISELETQKIDLTQYYTKTQVDDKLDEKQNVLTSGTNIDITDNVISTKNVPTTSEMNDAISTATNDMATETWVEEQGYTKKEDIVDNLEDLSSDKPISARAVNEDIVNFVDGSISDTMNYINQEITNEHAGRVAGDNLRELLENKVQTLDNSETHYPSSNAVKSVADDLSDRISNISSIGRFLSTWNTAWGLPDTNPVLPEGVTQYNYQKGDYYILDSVTNSEHPTVVIQIDGVDTVFRYLNTFTHGPSNTKFYHYTDKFVLDESLTPSELKNAFFRVSEGIPTIGSIAYSNSTGSILGEVTAYGTAAHKIVMRTNEGLDVNLYYADKAGPGSNWYVYVTPDDTSTPNWVDGTNGYPKVGDNVYSSASTSGTILGTIIEISDFVDRFIPYRSYYTLDVPSTKQCIEFVVIKSNDVYVYDGTTWIHQINSERTVSFDNIAGEPTDNLKLGNALNNIESKLLDIYTKTETDERIDIKIANAITNKLNSSY